MCPEKKSWICFSFSLDNNLWINLWINTTCHIIDLQYVLKNAMQLEFGHESQKSPNHILYPLSAIVSVLFAHKHGSEEWWTHNPMCPEKKNKMFFWQISLDRTYRSTPYARSLILQCVWKNVMQLEFGHESQKSQNHILYPPSVLHVFFYLHTNMEVKNDEPTIQCVLIFLNTVTIFG